jgi:hypothetical protein
VNRTTDTNLGWRLQRRIHTAAMATWIGMICFASVDRCLSQTPAETASPPGLDIQDLFESERIPNIVVTTEGTVLALAKSGRLFRRSEDGGQTWSPAQEVGNDAGGSAIVDENTGHVLVVRSRNGHLWRSRDDGKTWTREEIVVKPNPMGHGIPDGVPVQTSCSESGLSLRYGKQKGRLIMPARVQPPQGGAAQRSL